MSARVQVSDLSKRFGVGETQVVAVDAVSLQVEPGEVVLIMGPSGSGKTTLLLMLGGLLKPTAGSIELDGEEITGLSERDLPKIRLRKIGFIFQDFNLLSALDATDNVALVSMLAGNKRSHAVTLAEHTLTEMGLGARLHFLPEKLSGGEKQRVAIARSLINEPALLLADEPTANLDSKIGQEIARLLRRIAKEKGKSVVIVSHDQRLRQHADRVLWLEDGTFKELAAMVTDPVCGMAIEIGRSIPSTWEGQTYHFCSQGCRFEFMERHEVRPLAAGAAGRAE